MKTEGMMIITKLRHRLELENCNMSLRKFMCQNLPVRKIFNHLIVEEFF